MINLNTALSDLSLGAAEIADASLIVKARVIEAADTLAHVDVRMYRPPTGARTAWPEIVGETVGGHHAGYGINGSRVRYRPSAAAISRAEEVTEDWLPRLIKTDELRYLITQWALCMAAPWVNDQGSFRSWTEKNGRVRRTAERHITDGMLIVAKALLQNAQSLRDPDWSRVSPRLPKSDIKRLRMADVAFDSRAAA